MPERPDPKLHPHPAQAPPRRPVRRDGDGGPAYAELHACSNFSFLRGASHPEELVERAASLGYAAVSITDEASLAGVVRAHVAAKDAGIELIVGADVRTVDDAGRVVLLAPDRAAYARLSRLITRGRRRAPKGECAIRRSDVEEYAEGLLAIGILEESVLLPDASKRALDEEVARLGWLCEAFAGRMWIGAALHEGADDRARLQRYEYVERALGVPLVAARGIDAHARGRRAVRDALAAVREGCTVTELGRRLPGDGCRWLRERDDLAQLHRDRPDLLERTLEIAERCDFSLDELRYEYPDEAVGRDLRALTFQGAEARWPDGIPKKVMKLIEHELALIEELHYESYFLTVYDLVRYARSRGILCQGRGSAANSAVCYCLGVTAVDPDRFDVLFERFVSRDRNEPPDIDVDFEHERREEVIQYVYRTYGRERAALAATVITYRGRSAVRDVGKALGLSADQVDRLARHVHYWDAPEVSNERLREEGLDPDDETLRRVMILVKQIQGFPRHLSQHVGGLVITRGRLDELVPIENAAMEDRTVIQWDKDDLDALGLLKVDCLALGMLTAIHRAFDLIRLVRGRDLELATVPAESPAAYRMTHRADTVGTFQIESRAQMAMLPRFRPVRFYDLVIEVAIVRPGPIQGGMVHPYLRRRQGLEEVTYPSEALRSVLDKTLGVPIFQEQVMKLAVVAAGFTPGEADRLRRAMGAWRKSGVIDQFHEKLVNGMVERGYEIEFAEAVFKQIRGFGEYGFPESHAASFALLTYVSCWLKRFEPAAFTCALLNSQPMGFYGPAQLVSDAREHGVPVRPVDVTRSDLDCTLETDELPPLAEVSDDPELDPGRYGEGGPALRLGLRMIKGLRRETADRIVAVRTHAPFTSIEDCVHRARLDKRAAAKLAEAGAFRSLGRHRREDWWRAARREEEAPLFATADLVEETPELPAPDPATIVFADYAGTGLSLEAHPVSLLRDAFARRGYTNAAGVRAAPHGEPIAVAGISICRQRPATASGVLFITLEDETGFVNGIVRRREQERFRTALLGGNLLLLRGRIERADGVVHVMVGHVEDLSHMMRTLPRQSRDFH